MKLLWEFYGPTCGGVCEVPLQKLYDKNSNVSKTYWYPFLGELNLTSKLLNAHVQLFHVLAPFVLRGNVFHPANVQTVTS